ncbi:MAG: mRNA interferase HigB, partial [Phenylobacterium sp.]
QFWASDPKHMKAKTSLEVWHDEARKAHWQSPADIKAQYRHASILKGNRVVFNIKGNHYRVVVKINYDFGIVYIRFVGTHKQYDEIEVGTI